MLLLAVTAAIIFTTGCSEISAPVTDNESRTPTGKAGTEAVQDVAKITQIYVPAEKACNDTEAKDCFEPIIVTPGMLTELGNLDYSIANATEDAFFSVTTNYDSFWTSINSTILSDLQGDITFLRKVDSSASGEVEYRCIDQYGSPVDYSATP